MGDLIIVQNKDMYSCAGTISMMNVGRRDMSSWPVAGRAVLPSLSSVVRRLALGAASVRQLRPSDTHGTRDTTSRKVSWKN